MGGIDMRLLPSGKMDTQVATPARPPQSKTDRASWVWVGSWEDEFMDVCTYRLDIS